MSIFDKIIGYDAIKNGIFDVQKSVQALLYRNFCLEHRREKRNVKGKQNI